MALASSSSLILPPIISTSVRTSSSSRKPLESCCWQCGVNHPRPHTWRAQRSGAKKTQTHTHTHTQIEASHRRLPHRSRRRQPSALRSSSPPLSHTLRGSVLTTKSAVPAKCAQFRERFAAHLFRGVRAACGGPRGSSGCRGGGELRCCQGFWQGTSSQLTRWRKFAWQAILVCTLFGL